ncbi:MAG: 4Fe-4S dicluster domain-containing protein [Candidatus Omnitrophica bacterium]|nr:4Fe-4S dicluster domain-containing protein [Candidatus Omnitrophota bacterium]
MRVKSLFIPRENLALLIRSLKKNCDEFIAPRREHLGDIVFGDTKDDDSGELLEYDGNSVISPRAFLLPQTELLFKINSQNRQSLLPIKDKKKRIFYGVRPCDMKALTLMRKFFLDDFADGPYQEKLRRSTFIALACLKGCSSEYFCAEMGSGPAAQEGYDLQFIRLARGCLAQINSKKGEEIINRNRKLFDSGVSSAEKAEARDSLKSFKKGVKKINYQKLARIIRENKIKESVWDDIGERCVVCSGCITLCPTCSCFSVTDRMAGPRGERTRYCDGCPYAGFTRMAGGSIPEPRHKEHIRRFFEHKLNVDVKRYGTPSCVGCGRCINTCPGNISIRKFIDEALKTKQREYILP